MNKIVNIDSTYKCNANKAIDKFFKKYPEFADIWKETFEYMVENSVSFFCDNIYGDGTRNNDWSYALHLEQEENFTYIALIERA